MAHIRNPHKFQPITVHIKHSARSRRKFYMLPFHNKQRTGECLSSYGNIKHPPRLLRLVAIFVTKESEGRKSNFTRFRCESPPVSVDVLPDIIFLGKVKEFSNLGCPLWASHPWFFSVSQPRQIILTLLHYNQVQNR